jgi:hypothetical protein
MQTSFNSLFSAITPHFTDFLPASSIAFLYLTGDSCLIRHLTSPSGVRKFSHHVSHPYAVGWPRIVSQFHYLHTFELIHSSDMRHIPVEGVNLSILPKILRNLTLHFINGFASLHDPYPWYQSYKNVEPTFMNLKERWPQLERFSLMPQIHQRIPLNFDLFPSTLVQLQIRHGIAISDIAMIPHTITDLGVTFKKHSDCSIDPKFSPHLSRLRLSNVNTCQIYQHLPASLEHFEVKFTELSWENGDSTGQAGFHWLPRQMLRFVLSSWSLCPLTIQMLLALPRTILHLELLPIKIGTSAKNSDIFWNAFPPHLRKLYLPLAFPRDPLTGRMTMCDENMANALKNTEGGHNVFFHTFLTTNRAFSLIPPRFTFLNVESLTPYQSCLLPNFITTLKVGTIVNSSDSNINSGFGAMETSIPECDFRFPPSLTHLTVQTSIVYPAVSALVRDCAKTLTEVFLPPTALDFSMKLPFFENLETVAVTDTLNEIFIPFIPEKLKSLKTIFIRYIACSSTDEQVLVLLKSLPWTLTDLDLELSRRAIIDTEMVMTYINAETTPNLLRLSFKKIESIESRYFKVLPRRLTDLTLVGKHANYKEEDLMNLPQSLTHVNLDNQDMSTSVLPQRINLIDNQFYLNEHEGGAVKANQWRIDYLKQRFGPKVHHETTYDVNDAD